MKNITQIIRLAKPLYWLIVIISFLILIVSVVELVAPLLSKWIVDEIVARLSNKGGNLDKLIFYVSLAFFMNFIGVVLTSLSNRLGDVFQGRLRQFLTEKFYEKVLSLPQSYFDTEISGKILNQLNRGMFTIYQFINTSTNFIIPTLLQSLFTVIIMAYYNIWVGVFTFFLFPIYMVLSYFSTKQWGKHEIEKNKIEDYSRGRMNEVMANIKLVKSYNNERREWNIVSSALTQINKIYSRQSSTFYVYEFARNVSLIVIIFIINIIVFYNAFKGLLTIGEMVLILQLLNQARRPLFAMSFILTGLQQAESGSKEFLEILNLPSKENFDHEKTAIKQVKNAKIEFKDVSFKYEESFGVLKNLSFSLDNNETIALVGHSGVGKTTIINLILKLYNPTSGTILLNGQEYSSLDHSYIRHNMALVFQENELFSTTIRENVAYGFPDANDNQIIEALRKAEAYEFVKQLPKGVDSIVGERGVRLSGGQKQRIQIARAVLKDAPILILDEATSSLDSKSEKEVQEALDNLFKDRLVIIIAHRFSTLQNVDKVIVMDNGGIVDSGKPKDLSKRKGIYSELLRYQIEGNKKLLEKFDLTI